MVFRCTFKLQHHVPVAHLYGGAVNGVADSLHGRHLLVDAVGALYSTCRRALASPEDETMLLDDMPEDFDETVVLGNEWHKRHTNGDNSWSTGILFNIKDEHLHDATDRARLLAACRGQGTADGKPFTWVLAARKLWKRGGLEEDGFEQACAEAKEAPRHDGSTLRHYSRRSRTRKGTSKFASTRSGW